MKIQFAKELSLPIETMIDNLAKRRERDRKWRDRNRENLRIYFCAYRAAHNEKLKAYHADYYLSNVEKWRERRRRKEEKLKTRLYKLRNRERVRAWDRAWRKRNPDRVKKIECKTRERNRDKKRERDRIYRQQHPEAYEASIERAKAAKPELYRMIARQSVAVRRSRKRDAVIEKFPIKKIFTRDGMRCHLCLGTVEKSEASVDHLIPVVRHGAFAEWNLMIAHSKCNKSRGTKAVLPTETRNSAEQYIASRLATYSEGLRT